MDRQTWTDPAGAPALGGSRARVLDLVRAAQSPLGVRQIAEGTGLHPNTARFHLDALAAAGLLERTVGERDQPGRPRMIYWAPAADELAGRRSYRLLAEILTGLIAEVLPEAAESASEAGDVWGRYLTERPRPFQRTSVTEALERLVEIMTDLGFLPETVPDEAAPSIRLRHCPFREVAEHHLDIVCSLHLGLLRGVLAELRAPLVADRLEPFVEPGVCVARLSASRG